LITQPFELDWRTSAERTGAGYESVIKCQLEENETVLNSPPPHSFVPLKGEWTSGEIVKNKDEIGSYEYNLSCRNADKDICGNNVDSNKCNCYVDSDSKTIKVDVEEIEIEKKTPSSFNFFQNLLSFVGAKWLKR
jgi:hypothetical protein